MTPLTVVKVLLALVPRAVIAVMHTTMISASITAYSTAVGPSSAFRKFTRAWLNLRIEPVLSKKWGDHLENGEGRPTRPTQLSCFCRGPYEPLEAAAAFS